MIESDLVSLMYGFNGIPYTLPAYPLFMLRNISSDWWDYNDAGTIIEDTGILTPHSPSGYTGVPGTITMYACQ